MVQVFYYVYAWKICSYNMRLLPIQNKKRRIISKEEKVAYFFFGGLGGVGIVYFGPGAPPPSFLFEE